MDNYFYQDNLQSERLYTRFVILDDIDIWTTFFDEPECGKFFPTFGLPNAKARAEHWINRCLSRYEQKTYGLQALINKETGEYIGQCGLLLQEVDGMKELEIGYSLLRKHWGKGYASEAAQLFKNYGFQNKLAESIISIIHVDNIPSQQVAIRNGMLKEKQTKWNDLDVFIFRARQ